MIGVSDPEYGADSSAYTLTLSKQTDSSSERYGAYIQDQWNITDRWNVLSGVRVDGFKDKVNDLVKNTISEYQGSGLSYRLGSTYPLIKLSQMAVRSILKRA